jgi:hypothetical protein
MLLTRMSLVVVTLVSLPLRKGWKADSSGSAFLRTGRISGSVWQTIEFALLVAYWVRNLENSESVAREGWTEMITSEDRYATRATSQGS